MSRLHEMNGVDLVIRIEAFGTIMIINRGNGAGEFDLEEPRAPLTGYRY